MLGGHDPVSLRPEVVAAHVVCGSCVVFVSILFVGARDAFVLCFYWMMVMGPAVAAHVAREPEVASTSKTTAVTTVTAAGVGILPDGYQRTNLLPQIPTKQSVPTSREVLPSYFGLPIRIPMLRILIGPAIGKAQIPWLSCHEI